MWIKALKKGDQRHYSCTRVGYCCLSRKPTCLSMVQYWSTLSSMSTSTSSIFFTTFSSLGASASSKRLSLYVDLGLKKSFYHDAIISDRWHGAAHQPGERSGFSGIAWAEGRFSIPSPGPLRRRCSSAFLPLLESSQIVFLEKSYALLMLVRTPCPSARRWLVSGISPLSLFLASPASNERL